ncbi:MAG: right-handed parallel beta-helix repeat-containing protein, partial [Pseudonocardiaceae bacterium]
MTCVTDGGMLEIRRGGTPDAPVIYSGNGQTPVAGIRVEADNVVVQGFTLNRPQAPGIEAIGNNVTLQDNTILNPIEGDGDGIRLFGNGQKILHNSISGTSNQYGHADCMQSFTNDHPSTSNLLIAKNVCRDIDNQCLMGEGVGDPQGGKGGGESKNWTITGNVCEFGASQGYMLEYISDVTITDNQVSG